MTFQELQNCVVNISMKPQQFMLGDDLCDEDLLWFLELQEENGWSDEELIEEIKVRHYDPVDFNDWLDCKYIVEIKQ